MTTITAKFLVASSDKKNTLPAAADPNHAMNQPPQATAPELRRIPLPETVWKVRIGLDSEVTSSQERANISHLALLKHETQAINNAPAIFQTVSLRGWVRM